MFYYPNNADNAALGCYADYGSDTYNILLYIDDNKSRMNFVGEMLSRNGNSVLEYYFEGTINPSKFKMYYIPNITKYSLTLDGESTENTHPQVYNNGIEIVEELCLMPVQDTSVTLTVDLSLDSLRMVMLLVTLEDSFEIELDESDMNPFALITVQDVVNLVMKYVASAKEATEDA